MKKPEQANKAKKKRVKKTGIQILTCKTQAIVGDDGMALLFGLLGFSATKLWNTAVWHAKEQWESTGKIPGNVALHHALKDTRWYRSLHAQSSQALLEELWQSYKSWFKLRKKDAKAKPPGFRKKTSLSTVTFKKDSVRWCPLSKTLRLGIPDAVYGRKFIFLQVQMPPNARIGCRDVQVVRLIEHDGQWTVHIVYEVVIPVMVPAGQTMAIDLGIKQMAAFACTDGQAGVYTGGELRALERYFEKEKSGCTSSKSKKRRRLDSKRARQRHHFIHTLTRSIVRDAKARGVSAIIVGDLRDMRTGKDGEARDWGASGNQDLHKWPYQLIISQIRYKSALEGINVVVVSEAYTSQTCCICGTRGKANRVHRGLYVCKSCGATIHADVNGAANILKKYLPEITVPWSSGCLAQPTVNRFAWRKTRPLGHKPGTWQDSKRPAAPVNLLAA